MYFLAAVWLGKLIIWVSRFFGNAGSALPGLVVEKFYPGFIGRAAKQLKKGSILVTGTNGKTTTTKLLSGILRADNYNLVSNRAGSNMSRGVASALLEHMSWRGRLEADTALFEVDEAYMGDVAAKLKPTLAVVLNLLRDQLDRYGELDRTAELIMRGVKYAKVAVLNRDDPLVKAMGTSRSKASVSYFGAQPSIRDRLPADEQLHAPGNKLVTTAASKAELELTKLRNVAGGQRLSLKHQGKTHATNLLLPGAYNAYNAAAALLAAYKLGIPLQLASASIKNIEPAFGRSELIQVGQKQVQLLLVKNPSGFNQVINNFLTKSKAQPILMAINDKFADGRDVSWLWDVDFEKLGGMKRPVIASGSRGYDLALRLQHAEITANPELNTARALKLFITSIKPGETGYIIPTYTAMLGLRRLLKKYSQLKEVWHE